MSGIRCESRSDRVRQRKQASRVVPRCRQMLIEFCIFVGVQIQLVPAPDAPACWLASLRAMAVKSGSSCSVSGLSYWPTSALVGLVEVFLGQFGDRPSLPNGRYQVSGAFGSAGSRAVAGSSGVAPKPSARLVSNDVVVSCADFHCRNRTSCAICWI